MDLSQGNLVNFFTMGGPLMWPLLACGLAGLGVALERALYFFTTGYSIEKFERELQVESGALPAAAPGDGGAAGVAVGAAMETSEGLERWLPAAALRRRASLWARIEAAFVASAGERDETRDARLERLGTHLVEEMRRRVAVLSTIAGVAPLIGLLGTIGGMMLAFQQIAATGGQADIGQLADGLWVAMITTFAGLSVAIPAQLAYGAFQSVIRRRVLGMNNLIRLLEELEGRYIASPNQGEADLVVATSVGDR